MRYLKVNPMAPNHQEFRASMSRNRRKEVKSKVAKRMDRPHKQELIDNGYNKLMAFFFPGF